MGFHGRYLIIVHSRGLVLCRFNFTSQRAYFLIEQLALLLGLLKFLGDLCAHGILLLGELHETLSVEVEMKLSVTHSLSLGEEITFKNFAFLLFLHYLDVCEQNLS